MIGALASDRAASAAVEEVACICGESRTTARRVYTKDAASAARFTYLRCAGCGTERLSPRPGREAIAAFYPDTYAPYAARADSPAARAERLVYRVFYAPENRLGPALRPLLRVLLRPLRGHCVMPFRPPATRRVFEFGAAAGSDLLLFRAEGWEVAGCEPSAHACAIAAERGIGLDNCTAEAAAIAPESHSCILFNNVLEHVHDPVGVLEKCVRGLMPGGHLVVIVPNHASWSARLFGAAWPGYDAPRHLWGFTPRALRAQLHAIGLPVCQIYQMFPGRSNWRSVIDGRHQAAPVAAWRRGPARHIAMAPLLPLGWLAALCGHGDFMTIVARKPG
jgi:SAM-dependent methyltransferase